MTPATFDERCWILHVCNCTHIMFVPYLFTVPAAALAHSFPHLWMGKNVVILETKTHTGEHPRDIYFSFHDLLQLLFAVRCICATLYYLILLGSPFSLSLSAAHNLEVVDMEAWAVCSRDKADLYSSFLYTETTRDTDKAHQSGV